MASNPDTLPADFFKGKNNPDTLAGNFKGGKVLSMDRIGGRGGHGNATPEPREEDLRFGIPRLATGAEQLTNIGNNQPGKRLRGLHNVLTGSAELAAPAAVAGIAAAPVAAAGTAALGYLGGKAARVGGSLAGVKDEDVLNLLEDAGMMAGGAAGSRAGVRRAAGAVAERVPGVKWAKDTAGSARDAYRGPQPKVATKPADSTSMIVKPDGYKARGERSPEDLGKLPGESQPSRGPLQEPKSGVDAKKTQSGKSDAAAIADVLKKIGTTKADAATMSPLEWKLVFSNAKLKELPHPDVLKSAIELLQ